MKDLLDKISSYNLFNYLLPGILFVIFAQSFIGYNFIQENILLGAFIYYFIGMIISRCGSLCLEPILKKFSLVKFSDYKSFVAASKKDDKIELFSEINNTYRTIAAMFIILLILKLYSYGQLACHIPNDVSAFILVILLLILFLFSYRKQSDYIKKRIEATNTQEK